MTDNTRACALIDGAARSLPSGDVAAVAVVAAPPLCVIDGAPSRSSQPMLIPRPESL